MISSLAWVRGGMPALGGFFFSSRRRHTRFDCDWSSDLCSSDLVCRLLLEKKNLSLVAVADETRDADQIYQRDVKRRAKPLGLRARRRHRRVLPNAPHGRS